MHIASSSLRTLGSILLVSSMALTGCASKYGPQVTQVHFYPQCYKPLGDLRDSENATGKSTAGGAVAGALLGALIGGLATGKAEGALIGAAAGGATGAVAGNVYGKSQERKRDQEFFHQYASQLDGESAQMDRASATARVASKCYDQQFKQAVAMAKRGEISKIELTNRFEEIRSGLEETSRILTSTYNDMAQKDEQYRQVMEEEGQAPVAENRPSQSKRKPTRVKQTPTQTGASPQVQQASRSTSKWQNSKDNLEETRRDVQNQLNASQRTMEALEG